MRNDQFEQKVTLARLRREANRGRREGRFEIGDWLLEPCLGFSAWGLELRNSRFKSLPHLPSLCLCASPISVY